MSAADKQPNTKKITSVAFYNFGVTKSIRYCGCPCGIGENSDSN